MALNPLDRLVRDMEDVKRQLAGRSQLNHSSLENTAIPVYDDEGTERLRIGAQDDGTHAVVYVQGPPPPRPTAPVVSVDGPVVRVRWDGELMGGHIPEDFSRIDVHFALASEDLESPDAVRANLATSAGNETVMAATQTGTYRVGLVAMSQSRARSEMSEVVDVEVTLVDIEGALDAVVENARGGSNYYSPEPPSGTDHDPDRDLWFDTSVDAEGLVSYSPHRWDADLQEWVSVADQRTAALQGALGAFEGTVEQRFTDAGDRIDGLETSLTELDSTTLPGLRQDLDAAEGRLGEAEQDITDAFGQIESVRRAGGNLVTNGSFENGWTGWAVPAGVRLAVPHARDGDYVLRVGQPTANDYPRTDPVETRPGSIYQVEYWARKVPGGADTSLLRMYVQQFRADGTASGKYADFSVDGGSLPEAQWTRLSGTVEVTEPAAVSVNFAPHVLRQGTQYDIDSVRVVDVTEVTRAREAVEQAAQAYTDAQLSAEAADLTAAILAAQATADEALNAADGAIRTYYQTEEPTLVTHPELKVGDMWYDTDDEMAYRWNGSQWNVIQDSNVAVALAKAEEALATADGKITAYYQNDKPTEGHVGDLWFDLDDGNAPWYCASEDPAVWVPVRDEEIANAELRAAQDAKDKADQALQDAQEDATQKADAARDAAISAADTALGAAVSGLSSDIEGVRTAANGKNAVTWSTSSPPVVYTGRVDDTWFVMSGNGSGARVLSQWRWNGNVWVSTILSSAVLAQIDIGAGTFGELDGVRLKAGSIYADSIVSGLSQNMVPDPGFANEEINASRLSRASRGGETFSISNGVLTLSAPDGSTTNPNIPLIANNDLYGWGAYPAMTVVARIQMRTATEGDVASFRYTIRIKMRDGSTAYAGMNPNTFTPVTSEWSDFEARYVLPQEAVGFSVVLQWSSSIAGTVEARSPFVASSIGTTVIEDGAVTTGKLRADVLEVGNLKAGAGEIAELVSRKIAAATGQFLNLDVGQLTVTEQSRLADVVAEQIAADTARFMELEVGKLVASEGILDEAVIKQLFAEVVVSQMSFAESFIGGNAILEGSITAESGIIGSLDLGVAIVGKLHGMYIEGQTIGTEQLEFGAATGDILAVDALNFKTAVGLDIRGSSFRAGDAVEITEDFGIRQFGPDGALNVSLPSDGSEAQFRGDLSARTLTATGRMAIQGPGAIASGGVLELESGVTPPISPPQVSQWWASTSMPPLAEGESVSGLVWADGHWWRGVQVTGASSENSIRARVEKITADGVLVSSFPTAFGTRINGITYLGGLLYVLGAVVGGELNNRFVIAYNLTGTEQYRWKYLSYGTGTYQPGIGVIGTNIAIAQCWASGELSWRIYRPTDGYQIQRVDRDTKVASDIVSINLAAYDLGTPRIVLGVSRQTNASMQVLVYTNSITNPAWVSEESWYAADYAAIRGLAWDGSLFHTLQPNGDLAQYEPNEAGRFLGDNESDWRVAIGWASNDGSRVTPAGPPSAPFRFLRRSRHTKTINDVPEGVERARFYYAKTVGDVSRTDLHSVSFIGADARLAWSGSLPGDWATRSNPPAVNSFVADKPGEIRSAIGNFRVDGSGAGRWGPLKFGADGTMTGPWAAGIVAHGPVTNGAGGFTPATVTFPAGRFSSPPVVVATSSYGRVTPELVVDSITKDSATIRARNFSGGEFPAGVMHWIAMEG